MQFDIFLQQIANGLAIGTGYALVAAGLALIFGIMGVINFAHGEFYVLGAYGVLLAMQKLGANYFGAVAIAVCVSVALGLAVQRVIIEPQMKSHHLNVLLATFGLSLLIHYSLTLTQGSTGQQIRTPFGKVLSLGPVVLVEQRVVVLAAGLVVFAGLFLFLARSSIGRLMRSAAQNRHGAMLVGVNVRAVERITFGLGAGLAGLGGALLGPLAPIVPGAGETLTIKAFAVIVLGGMGSLGGAIVAGLLLGVVEALGAGYVSSAWKDGFAFMILLLVLLLKPAGLFGREPS